MRLNTGFKLLLGSKRTDLIVDFLRKLVLAGGGLAAMSYVLFQFFGASGSKPSLASGGRTSRPNNFVVANVFPRTASRHSSGTRYYVSEPPAFALPMCRLPVNIARRTHE